MSKKEFVEFYFPGVSLAGQKEREVASRELDLTGMIPEHAISYRFFSKDTNGNKVDYSPYHFIGTEYSAEEFKIKYPQLKDDPELSNAKRVVKTVTGGFYPITDNDLVTSPV